MFGGLRAANGKQMTSKMKGAKNMKTMYMQGTAINVRLGEPAKIATSEGTMVTSPVRGVEDTSNYLVVTTMHTRYVLQKKQMEKQSHIVDHAIIFGGIAVGESASFSDGRTKYTTSPVEGFDLFPGYAIVTTHNSKYILRDVIWA